MSAATLPPPMAAPIRDPAALLDVQAVAQLLDCSSRNVYRLADAGRMPAPVKIGALVRWKWSGPGGLEEWITNGCPIQA
jgi:predicted DNA-binding transcriptional regulator AlpA